MLLEEGENGEDGESARPLRLPQSSAPYGYGGCGEGAKIHRVQVELLGFRSARSVPPAGRRGNPFGSRFAGAALDAGAGMGGETVAAARAASFGMRSGRGHGAGRQ